MKHYVHDRLIFQVKGKEYRKTQGGKELEQPTRNVNVVSSENEERGVKQWLQLLHHTISTI